VLLVAVPRIVAFSSLPDSRIVAFPPSSLSTSLPDCAPIRPACGKSATGGGGLRVSGAYSSVTPPPLTHRPLLPALPLTRLLVHAYSSTPPFAAPLSLSASASGVSSVGLFGTAVRRCLCQIPTERTPLAVARRAGGGGGHALGGGGGGGERSGGAEWRGGIIALKASRGGGTSNSNSQAWARPGMQIEQIEAARSLRHQCASLQSALIEP
jgi:hypothetical protein